MSTLLHDAGTDHHAERYGWKVLSVTALGVMLCFINASTVNVALPVIARDLNATAIQASWILLSYMLLSTVLILVFGRWADLIGRRRLYIAGLTLLVVGSTACAFSTNAAMLLVFRCIQAIGAASVITNSTALLADAFPARKLGFGLGVHATISAAAQGLGPLVGGAIVSTLGWRAIFLMNLPLGLIAIFWAVRTLNKLPFKTDERFDTVGAVLSMIALAGLVYALSMGGPNGWTDTTVFTGAVVGVAAFVAFVISQRHRAHPLVDLSLFTETMRSVSYVSVLLICMTQISSILLMALYLQAVHGLNAMHAGLAVAPAPIGMMLASPIAGKLIGRMRNIDLCLTGLFFTLSGLIVLACVLTLTEPSYWIEFGLFLVGAGSGLFLTPNNNGIMQSVLPRRRGIANGVRAALQNTGYVVGSALALSVATAPLSRASQQAAYAGRLGDLSATDVLIFVGGCRSALIALALICVVAIAVSLWARRLPNVTPVQFA